MFVDVLKDNKERYIKMYINENLSEFFHYNKINNIIHFVIQVNNEGIHFLNLFYNEKDNILLIEKIHPEYNKCLADFQKEFIKKLLINSSYIGECNLNFECEKFLSKINDFENLKNFIIKEG